MRTLYILVVIALVFTCCNDNKKVTSFNKNSLKGAWLVQSIERDKDFYMPRSFVLELEGDSLCYSNLNNEIFFKERIQFSQDSLLLDTIQFSIDNFSIIDNKLRFLRNIGSRMQPADTLNAKKIEAVLRSNNWKNDIGIYSFHNEEDKVSFVSINEKEHYTYCFELKSYQDAVFLQKKGNQLACNRNPQFIEQVLSVSDTEIVTFGFVDGDFKKIVYAASSGLPDTKSVQFQLCNKYINKNFPWDRYYYQGTEYKGGLYHIRKIFSKQYKVPQNSTESGIFQVRFVVNCEGKAGMFETQAFDYDYKLKKFSAAISDQILEITKGLQEWSPGRNQRNNQAIDTYFYISYRIENGKITRIYP